MLMRSRVQSWACLANHHWQLDWSACAVLDSPVWNCTCLCKLITQMEVRICKMCGQAELGTNQSSLEAFLFLMCLENELLLCLIPFAVLSWKMLLSCGILSVKFNSLPGVEVCLHMADSIFISFKNTVFSEFLLELKMCMSTGERTCGMRKPESPVLIPVGACCSSCNQKHGQFHSRVAWVFIGSSRNAPS